MGVFCSMDKMVDKDFEDGLASSRRWPGNNSARGLVRLDLIV